MGARSGRGVLRQLDRLWRGGTAAGVSDARLLEQFLGRHDEVAEAAFAALVERHGPMVMGVCWRALGNHHDAQDAFQATFLVLARKAGTVRNRGSLVDWLYGVARRVSAHARAAAARRREIERRAGEGTSTAVEANPTDPDLWDEVDRLPHVLRHAVILCYLEGLTHEQAALRLGWPVGTVRSRLARARDRLRVRLTRRGLAPGAASMPFLALKPTALSWELISTMAQAAIHIAARDAAEAGLVSISATSLTEGVLHTMLVMKLKTAAALILTAGALASGAAVWGYQDIAPRGRALPKPASPSADFRESGLATQPAGDAVSRSISEAYIARLEELLKSARARHANGSAEGVHQDVLRIEHVVGQWKDALNYERRSTGSVARPVSADFKPATEPRSAEVPLETRASSGDAADLAAPGGASPRGTRPPDAAPPSQGRLIDGESRRRLDELERKVDRILKAVEKDVRPDRGGGEPTTRKE